MTTGAPRTAVTVLMASSVGANTVRATRSHTRQNTAPKRKLPGRMREGFEEENILFVRCGTAIPTKETGPAYATTHAERREESKRRSTRNSLTFMPMLCAYPSPSRKAEMGLTSSSVPKNAASTKPGSA